MKQALLDEEQRREKPSESGGSEVALKSAHKLSSKKRKAGYCFNCGQPSHFAQDCFKQKHKQKSTKEYHRAKRVEEQEDTDFNDNEMFVATVGLKADMQSNDWIIDSGASRHMTFESRHIRTLRPQNQLGLEMAIRYQQLDLVRSRSLHNYTMVRVLFVG